jgi:hypothetical protein
MSSALGINGRLGFCWLQQVGSQHAIPASTCCSIAGNCTIEADITATANTTAVVWSLQQVQETFMLALSWCTTARLGTCSQLKAYWVQ